MSTETSANVQFSPLLEQYFEAVNKRDLDAILSKLSFPLRLINGPSERVLDYDAVKADYQSHWDDVNFTTVTIKELEDLPAPEKGARVVLHDVGRKMIMTVNYEYELAEDGEWKHVCHRVIALETVA
ncbi:hypothetical protein CVT24_007204 [Panaeolus cyanescens]|uniref:SnoaL-like domain-containing protein n=1 Tax=Panaeolus cyanescens TaxID=181874 RepID=A0A409VJL1_9AGAR|nr:hypothetical protein CVT24_007204 [Panaeolus cyanescens]